VWEANLVVPAELPLEAIDELVVPFVMRAFATALNKEHLTWHRGF
jgi:hypothetical protein